MALELKGSCEKLCVARVARSRLAPSSLMVNSIGEKTFLADRAHINQRTMDAGGQELLAYTCQRRCLGSAEQVGRDREIELID